MMKKIKPLLAIPLLLLCGAKAKPRYVIVPSMEMGPYTKYQSDPIVSYKITSTYTTEKSIFEVFRFGSQSYPNQRSVTKATHTIAAKGSYEGAVTVPTSIFLSDEGMSVTVQLYWGTGEIMRESSFIIYPTKQETIDPTSYQGTYTCPQTHMEMKSSIVHFTNEQYSFPHVDDYFLTDIYYRLPLEQFVIQTTLSVDEFDYESAHLLLQNLEEYFPGLTFRSGLCSIPLLVSYDNGILTLSLEKPLFVNAYTLALSSISRPGYRTTKNFYLPINRAKDLVGTTFTILISKVGFNKTTFKWETTLLSESPLIGDCQNSGYCVVGNVKR